MAKKGELGIYLPITKDIKEVIIKELERQGFVIKFEEVNFTLGNNKTFHVEVGVEHKDLEEILKRDIDFFDLSISTLEPLRRGGVQNLNDLLNYSAVGLKDILKLSQRTIDEIKEVLPPGYVLKFEE